MASAALKSILPALPVPPFQSCLVAYPRRRSQLACKSTAARLKEVLLKTRFFMATLGQD